MTDKILLLDGAMGTQLQKKGFDGPPVDLNLTYPDLVAEIHQSYLDAGSDILYTNTFSANGRNYPDRKVLKNIIQGAIRTCKGVAQGKAKVAFDMGPLGALMEPMGTMIYEEAFELFEENILLALEEGVDLVVLETMSSLLELRAAILAVKKHFKGPLLTTMTFEKDGRTFSGVSPQSFAVMANSLGVEALGVNCSLGPLEMKGILEEIRQVTDKPLVVKANAGLPDEEGRYKMKDQDFIQGMEDLVQLGVAYLGGCCGTTPETIKGLAGHFKGRNLPKRRLEDKVYLASSTKVLNLDQEVLLVGEAINPTGRPRLRDSILKKDMEEVLRLGVDQEEAGAHILDVNVSIPGTNEGENLAKASLLLQGVVDCPLQLDSSNPQALEEALKRTPGRPVINSVNGTKESMDQVLPLAKTYGAQVIALTLDEGGIPKTAKDRLKVAEKILHEAEKYGLKQRDLVIDPLILTIASHPQAGQVALETLSLLKEAGFYTTMGTSNISFGLPHRSLITGSFLLLALDRGCNMPIVNPMEGRIQEALKTYRVLMGLDDKASDYIQYMDQENAEEAPDLEEKEKGNFSVYRGMRRSQKKELLVYVQEALKTKTPMEIIQEDLIPALDQVGQDYENKVIYLPQLIGAASAAQEAFAYLRDQLKEGKNQEPGEKILLATVKGDIHDIGKNIAKVLLENYGYQVYDLGKNVDKEEILDLVIKEDIRLVGLSALMTTTVTSMEETITLLKEKCPHVQVMVGGAVLTQAYAREIGAHYYCKDAKEDVEIAKEIFL